MTFPIGTILTPISDNKYNRAYITSGKEYKVIGYRDSHPEIINDLGQGWTINPHNWTVVEKLVTPVFKVGDKVKAIKGTAILKLDGVYEIVKVKAEDDEYYVDRPGYGVAYYNAEYFELAKDQPINITMYLTINYTETTEVVAELTKQIEAAISAAKGKLSL